LTEPGRIIFTGNMSYYPNADGAKFLAERIFPLIKRRAPQAKLYIVGQQPPASVRALARDDVTVTGFVKDLRAEYGRSAVAVSPIRFGAGTLNKILEPLAMGVPVVATSHGVSGLELQPGSEILVADTPEQFADHVVRLLTDEVARERIATAATDRIRSRFNWDAVGRSLLETYNNVVTETRRVPAPAQE
ncbi:MAG TPA: glycosyltransferase, partial [Bacteroidota bacterium]